MTEQHTQGLPGRVLLTEDGTAVYALGPDGFNSHFAGAQGTGREAFAAELVRRWNAFEEGGAVAVAIEALTNVVDLLGGRETLWPATAAKSRAALAALVEPGAGVRE